MSSLREIYLKSTLIDEVATMLGYRVSASCNNMYYSQGELLIKTNSILKQNAEKLRE